VLKAHKVPQDHKALKGLQDIQVPKVVRVRPDQKDLMDSQVILERKDRKVQREQRVLKVRQVIRGHKVPQDHKVLKDKGVVQDILELKEP
jgi:hypothetical protein